MHAAFMLIIAAAIALFMVLSTQPAAPFDNSMGGKVHIYTPKSCNRLRTLDTAAYRQTHFELWGVKPGTYVSLAALHVARTRAPCMTPHERIVSRRWLENRGLTEVRFQVLKGTMTP